MKTAEFVGLLGDKFAVGEGYPVLTWEGASAAAVVKKAPWQR